MCNLTEKKKCVLFSIAILLLVFLMGWVGVDISNKLKEGKYIGQEIETKNTITFSGTGEVYAKPDLAITTFSVVTEAKTVTEAMKENNEKMSAITKFVKDSGVEDKDLKTTYFYISPRYEYNKECALSSSYCPYDGTRVLVGYEITQSLQVKIRDLTKIGGIVQGATDAGANQGGDLQFTIDNEDELKNQARNAAIKEAKTKAQDLASQLGVKLVRIISFSENNVYPYYDYKAVAVPSAAGMGGEEAVAQVETGENKIEATVNITYEIR